MICVILLRPSWSLLIFLGVQGGGVCGVLGLLIYARRRRVVGGGRRLGAVRCPGVVSFLGLQGVPTVSFCMGDGWGVGAF